MSFVHDSAIAGASGNQGGYKVERSLRFNNSDSANLSRAFSTPTNAKIGTFSFWCKRSKLGSGAQTILQHDSNFVYFGFDNNGTGADTLGVYLGGNTTFQARVTTQVFRDPSSWYHFILAVDTTQGTASERLKLYVNGSQITTFSTNNTIDQNIDVFRNGTYRIGSYAGSAEFLGGYLAEIHFIDGQALTPSSFGETNTVTGQWVPKAYSGTYGTNGFQLKFADNSNNTATTLGKDTSGNGNNWTPNNLSVAAGAGNDSLVDTPTSYGTDTGAGGEVRGNYATLNPLNQTASVSLTNGNIQYTNTATNSWMTAAATFGLTSGKWYFEAVPTGMDANNYMMIGAANLQTWSIVTSPSVWNSSTSYTYYGASGKTYNNNVDIAYGASYTNNDIIGVALDVDGGKIWFSKNGVWQASGDPAAGTNAAYTGITATPLTPVISSYSNNTVININFGQRQWAYAAPAGFKALCDTNLPTPVVAKPNTVMDVKLWTGNGSARSITGYSFSPDFAWLKIRSNAGSHFLFDTVRGATNELRSNSTNAENSFAQSLTAFNSDGFSLGTDNAVNGSSDTYVGWAWDAGSSTVTNTQGSITSQVRANASAGFSIVTYTGTGVAATIGHGLGVAPRMIIVKSRTGSPDVPTWRVYHASVGATQYLELNSTSAATTYADWNNTTPTSTVFSVGAPAFTPNNQNGINYVAYCFAPVAGYSSFGSYTGNGSTDGPFVYTGFRPRFVLIKRTDVNGYVWVIYDTARNISNVSGNELYPDRADAEYIGSAALDILSNGFKIRTTSAALNASGGTCIYAAFAESPFQYARAR